MNFFRSIKRTLRNYVSIVPYSDLEDIKTFLRQIRPIEKPLKSFERIGTGDGSYIVPTDILKSGFLLSPGVSEQFAFDNYLAENGIEGILYDGSIDRPEELHRNLHFKKKFIGTEETHDTINFRNELRGINKEEIIIQMDIEGAEYNVLLSLTGEELKKVKILIIEFHNIDKYFTTYNFPILKQIFQKILQDFEVYHINVNNIVPPNMIRGIPIPPYLEMTFVRGGGSKKGLYSKNDQPTFRDRASINLDEAWNFNE